MTGGVRVKSLEAGYEMSLPGLKRPAEKNLRGLLVVFLGNAYESRVVESSTDYRAVCLNGNVVGVAVLDNRFLLAERVQL